MTFVLQEILDFRKWGWQNEDTVLCYHIGQHSKMPVRLASLFCNASAKGLTQGTVDAVSCTGLCKCEGGCVNNDDV